MALCPSCAPVQAARDHVLSGTFWSEAGTVVIPLVVVVASVVVLAVLARRWPLACAGLALGIGLGGFIDGIVLHQLLQWHGMVSSAVPTSEIVGAKVNMIWDGVFHLVIWLACAAGVALLFRAARRADVAWSARVFSGAMLAGWGAFNLAEGMLDHLILGLHHVHPGEDQLAWDVGFVLLGGVGLIAAGWLLARMRTARDDDHLGPVPSAAG